MFTQLSEKLKLFWLFFLFLYLCTQISMMKIGYDAKRIVRNGTGLGNYGRTLVNDIAQHDHQLDLRS